MKAFFILSIVAPMALLTTFRLTGILQGPIVISETSTLEAKEWELQRPNQFVNILKELGTIYETGGLSVNLYAMIVSFSNNSQFRGDNDYLRLLMIINATSINPAVSIEGIHVIFSKDIQSSVVDWLETSFRCENLSVPVFSNGWTDAGTGLFKQASVSLIGKNHPSQVYFSAVAEWSLLSPKSQTHEIAMTYEVVYFNGTACNRIIQPLDMALLGG